MNSFLHAKESEVPNLFMYDCEMNPHRGIKPLSRVQGQLKSKHSPISTHNGIAPLPDEGIFCTAKISLLIYTKLVILHPLLLLIEKQGKLSLQGGDESYKNST